MSPEVAASHVRRITDHLEKAGEHLISARALILDLYEQKGWAALGYKSWSKCVQGEFTKGISMLYKELKAAHVETQLHFDVGSVSERVLRPLTKKGYTAEARQAVWDIAQNIVGEGGKVTSGVIEQVAIGLEEMLVSGATQGPDGAQHAITEHMAADLTARVRETRIAHKEHIRRMGAKRTYIMGGVAVDKVTRGQLGQNRVAAVVVLDDMAKDLLIAAQQSGKPIYISMWTEEAPNASG